MSNEIALRYPNLTSGVPTAVAHPKFAVFAGLTMFNGTTFVAQSDATAWASGCFFALTPISTHASVFTGDYQANMPSGIDLTQTYTIRMYNASGVPTPGTELPPLQVWSGAGESGGVTQQQIAQVIHATQGSVWFVSQNGNDTTGTGLSPSTPYASATKPALANADVLRVAAGAYGITAQIQPPGDLQVIGAGLGQTVFSGVIGDSYDSWLNTLNNVAANGTILVSDLSVLFSSPGTAAVIVENIGGMPLSLGYDGGNLPSSVQITRCLFQGDIDAIYGGCQTLTIEDSVLQTRFDNTNLAVQTFVARRTTFRALGDGTTKCRAFNLDISAGQFGTGPYSAVLFDCDIIASNSNGQDCYGVQGTGLLSDGANIPCVMILIKCRIHVANSGDGATYAIAANGADNGNGVVICYGCDFDRTLTNGNVIDLPLSALPVELKGLGASGTFSDPDSARLPTPSPIAGLADVLASGTIRVDTLAIATAVWTDTTGSDFTTAGSPGMQLQTTLPAAVSAISVGVTPPTAAQNATAVWQAAQRTLTGTGGAIGPTAGANLGPIAFGPVVPGQTLDLSACVSINGQYITAEETSAIVYTIVDCDSGLPVPGHVGVALVPATPYVGTPGTCCLSDTILTDAEASNYNFRFRPSLASKSPFPECGRYAVAVTFTVGGQPYFANFEGRAEW